MENSIEKTKKQLELILKVRKEQKEIIECAGGTCMNCDPDIKALSESIEILSDYKRVLKENEELKQEKINNHKMIALAQTEALGYMRAYEDGKNSRTSAIASIVENQQYYIIKKQKEKYEEYIEKLQKENNKLNIKLDDKEAEIQILKDDIKADDIEYKHVIEILKKENEEYSKQLDLDYVDKNYISKQEIEDKIEEIEEKIKYEYNKKILVQLYKQRKVLQELLNK